MLLPLLLPLTLPCLEAVSAVLLLLLSLLACDLLKAVAVLLLSLIACDLLKAAVLLLLMLLLPAGLDSEEREGEGEAAWLPCFDSNAGEKEDDEGGLLDTEEGEVKGSGEGSFCCALGA